MGGRNVPGAAIFAFVLLAVLGTGAGTLHAADLSGEKVLFEENFGDELGKDWSWLREIPGHWKIDKERKELMIRPVWSEGNLKNIPLRMAPDVKEGPLAIEVHIDHVAVGEYEYSGLIWYIDDKNYVVIRKGPHGDDGNILTLVRRKADKQEWIKSVTYNDPAVDLRMVVTSTKAQGWYRASSMDKWQPLGEVELPSGDAAKVGFRTGNGEGPSWARFSKFRILQLDR